MAKNAADPTVERTGYTTPAVPRKTPDRSIQIAKKRYKVVGPHEVFGVPSGEIAELELTEGQESALISGGHLEEVPDEPATNTEED